MDFFHFTAELSGGTLAVDVSAQFTSVVGAIDPQNPPPPPSK